MRGLATLSRWFLGLGLLGLLVVGVGCYAETGMIAAPEYAYGYPPVYYHGYVVYYDDVGRPYYYVNGAAVWVPSTVRVFPALVRHWRTYRPAYRHWYHNSGHRYRSYRFQGRRHH